MDEPSRDVGFKAGFVSTTGPVELDAEGDGGAASAESVGPRDGLHAAMRPTSGTVANKKRKSMAMSRKARSHSQLQAARRNSLALSAEFGNQRFIGIDEPSRHGHDEPSFILMPGCIHCDIG
jgi:hypothetical protein